MHSRFHGSAFRNKIPNDQNSAGIEEQLKESGLLGKNPNSKTIIRSNSSLFEPPQKIQELPKITRPKTRQNKTVIKQIPTTTRLNEKQKQLLQEYITPRRPQTAKIQPQVIEKEAPNIFYGKILLPNEPPSETNFSQLSELLDRLIEDQPFNTPSVYYKIFGDIVRQYYIECTAQGDLLNQCREFFADAQDQIPGIKDSYNKRVSSIEQQASEIEAKSKLYGPEVTKNEEKSRHLTSKIEDMRNDLSVLVEHHDAIIKQVGIASKEAAKMKEEMMQLDNRIKEKNKVLMDLNTELRTLDTLSSDYTADTLRFAENLKQIRQQQDETADTIKKTNGDMTSYKLQIQALDKEIIEATELIEKSRAIPDKAEIDIQCDLVSRRLFSQKKDTKEEVKSVPKSAEISGDLFQRITQEFQKSVLKPQSNKEIVAGTYDEFSKLKSIIISHEKEFRMDDEEIKIGQSGDYIITPESTDYLRLFASRIVSSCITNACRTSPKATIITQTLNPQTDTLPETEKKGNVEKKTAFLNLLKSDYSKRSPRRLDWVIEEIRQIYDAKTVQNQKAIENHQKFGLFSNFVFEFGKRKMNLDFLTDQYCWDLYISSHEHADRTLEVELFVGFLDDVYDEEQLAFFLRARTDCIKVGCSVPVKTRDQLETLNEYYLSQDQIEKALKRWWAKRYQRKIFLSILEMSIARPAIHLESTKRYVAMHDILQICIIEYQNDVTARLNEQLMQYRIVPRLNSDQFTNLMISLIPKIGRDQAKDFYRATVTKAKQREDIDVDDFIEKFNDGCLLYHQDMDEPSYEVSGVSEIHNAAEQLWFRSKQNIIKVIEFFQNQIALQPDNLALKMYLDDATRYMSMLGHSLTTGDGEACSQHYISLILTLDIMFSTIGYINSDLFKPSLLSMECAIRESWLDNVFDK